MSVRAEAPATPRTLGVPAPLPPSAERSPSGPSSLPAHVQLVEMVMATWTARAVYAAAELGLADHLAHGPRSVDELARTTGTHPPSLLRLMRALAGCGLFRQVADEIYALTDKGAALRTDAPGAARATVLTLGGQWQWRAWENVIVSLQTGEPGLKAAFGVPLFEYLAAHPQDGARFGEAMVGLYAAVAPAVVEAYDFSLYGSVVDVGGGTGSLLATILRANQHLRGVLLELPGTLPEAQRSMAAANVSERCELLAGDFFEAVPAGHDLYLLAHVLHDWDDAQAATILRNCRRAGGDHARLVIVESIVPTDERSAHSTLIDLLMLTVTGGRERTAEEFAGLLTAEGFRMLRTTPIARHQSIIEAAPVC